MGGEYGEWCIGLAELRFQYLIDENTCRDATVVYTNGYCEITERNPAGDSQLESVGRLLLSRMESIMATGMKMEVAAFTAAMRWL